MAEALVSSILEELASFASQQIQKEFGLVSGIEKKVGNLHSKFEAIQAVLVDAEKRQITDESVRRWLDKLKEASYEMDAVLDEWNTAITLRSNLKLSGKVLLYSQSCFHPNQLHRLVLRRRIACKIEELNEKLTNLSIEKETYTFSTQNVNNEQLERKTTSSINVSEVYGRKTEIDILVKELLSESSQAGRGYDIIPIVGTGGIGKTTLAQLVYNHETVSAHFNLKIWVCVSDPFHVTTVARAILEALKASDAHQLVELETLKNRIQELIQGKKFFLVLDDVWTEDRRKWEQLENCLNNGAVGSKILVTTRKDSVANMMAVETDKIINLKNLSDEICWNIFCQVAFFNRKKSKELEEIDRRIAQKCKGLPLVAKTLGGLMRFKEYTSEEWMKVLNSELWKLGNKVENEVFVPLLLSYYDLPSLEKRCFSYCSYFLKDDKISRDDLIELWLSQGFLSSKKDYEAEGVDCFKNLVARSVFQDFEKDNLGNIIRCKMHDIIHDFVMFLTKNECFNLLINSKEEKIEPIDEKAFHCTLVLEPGEQIPTSIYNKKSLRTLCVRNLGKETTIRWNLLLSLTNLRTLRLHKCGLKQLPKNIDKLIHLRYLRVSENGGCIELPDTMCNLVTLQTLRLSVKALPKRIGKLVNLRHLYLDDDVIAPKELGKLTSLETLDAITFSSESNALVKKVMALEDLSKLNHLKRLSIVIGKVKDVEEAKRAPVLKNKQRLTDLFLDFEGSETMEAESKFVLLEGLEPHPNLKDLTIWNYNGITLFPSWMTKLVHLKTLTLFLCPNCEVLGAFGKLPSLELLRVWRMDKVKRVGLEFLGIDDTTGKTEENCSKIESFPKLKQLAFYDLERWEEWKLESSSGLGNNNNGDDDDHSCLTIIMPSLVSLSIKYCNSLKPPLPAFLQKTPLQNLTIEQCQHLERHHREGMRTEDFIKILTTTPKSAESNISGMTEETTSSRDQHQVSPTNIAD